VTLYDLRGHGRSGMAESGYAAPNMASDLKGLLDHLGIRRSHFIAHSFGGAVALNLAVSEPTRFASLSLLDTHIHSVRTMVNREWKFSERIRLLLMRNRIDLDVKEPYFGYKLLGEVARLKVTDTKISRELEDLMSPLMGTRSEKTASQWLKLLNTTRAEKELMSDDGLSFDGLAKLGFPILAVYGERSQAMTTGEQLLDVWPHGDFRKIRDAGHFFPVTRPVEFREACRQFWNGSLLCGIRCRAGDSSKRFFRSDRFYIREGKWFFDTRESLRGGPFNGLAEAKEALSI
jgi:pimeloyl-ACP methyl ester carboxylesterase